MDSQTAKKWRVLSRGLKVVGAVGCIVTFGLSMGLISYYSANRPHAPQPGRGWTVGITWTHPPSYGTPSEESRLLWLSWSFFPFFGLGALSEAIKMNNLDDYSGIPASRTSPALKRN